MPRTIHKPEKIVANLRQIDMLVSQGQSVDAIRAILVGAAGHAHYGKKLLLN